MKIKSIKIKNIKSFKNSIELELNPNFNILIGPNGSGKSNLLDILTICMRQFFLKGYTVNEGNEARGFFKDISQNNVFGNIHRELEKFYGDVSDSEIELNITVKEEDIQNIKDIVDKLDLYEMQAKTYRNYPNFFNNIRKWNPAVLQNDCVLNYKIKNNELTNPTADPEKLFLQYLNYFEQLLIFAREIPDVKLYPNYLYFSPYRAANLQNLQANLSGQNFYQVLQELIGATSKTVLSLINLATLYFAVKRRKFEDEATELGYIDKWKTDDEVKLVTKYLEKLGYSWDLKLIDKNKNIYEILLTKEEKEFYINQASSGEKEIINFLLGVFAFHLNNGLIVIDEPELHLHPRWQKVLLELFIELSSLTRNQFIISTHSPTFINDKSYNHIIRVYKDNDNISNKVVLKDSETFKIKDILHIVNSTNNEKMFFADVVVLVEGITDRLVFQKIIGDLVERNDISKIIEIVEIKGKTNQDKFRAFLDNLEIPSYFIADLDFINEIGTEGIKALFQTNESKIEKDVIKNPKSKDGDSLVQSLEEAITSNSTVELKDLWEYIKSFRRKLRPDLKGEEQKLLDEFILEQQKNGVFLLSRGDIEDYFPEGFRTKNIENVISLLKNENYSKWQENKEAGFDELAKIAQTIIAAT